MVASYVFVRVVVSETAQRLFGDEQWAEGLPAESVVALARGDVARGDVDRGDVG